MRKKHAPEQYTAKPKTLAAKPNNSLSTHPARGVAKVLVSWMERGGLPPSIILLHGLHLARSAENDGLPVDTYRPQLKMEGTDNKVISAMLDALARPQTDKTQAITVWLQSVWVNKYAFKPRDPSSKKEHKNSRIPKKSISTPRKAKANSSVKSVIEVKKKR